LFQRNKQAAREAAKRAETGGDEAEQNATCVLFYGVGVKKARKKKKEEEEKAHCVWF